MKTITGKVKAWISSPDAIDFSKEKAESYWCSNFDMSLSGWVCAGSADVTIHLDDDKTVVSNMVESLRKQQKTIQAAAQMEVTRIEEKIQSLLALPSPS